MAQFEVTGLDELVSKLGDLEDMFDDIAPEILTAQADELIEETRSKGRAMGVHRTGQTLDSLKKSKVSQVGASYEIKVTFEGKNRAGERNAAVAFINNYGKTNQPARPFVTQAAEACEEKSEKTAEKAVDKYLKQKGL